MPPIRNPEEGDVGWGGGMKRGPAVGGEAGELLMSNVLNTILAGGTSD